MSAPPSTVTLIHVVNDTNYTKYTKYSILRILRILRILTIQTILTILRILRILTTLNILRILRIRRIVRIIRCATSKLSEASASSSPCARNCFGFVRQNESPRDRHYFIQNWRIVFFFSWWFRCPLTCFGLNTRKSYLRSHAQHRVLCVYAGTITVASSETRDICVVSSVMTNRDWKHSPG